MIFLIYLGDDNARCQLHRQLVARHLKHSPRRFDDDMIVADAARHDNAKLNFSRIFS